MPQLKVRKLAGFSLIELLIVVAIILIIASIAIPSLLRSRMAANEASAASTLRTINVAEVSYITNFPGAGYSQSLQSLSWGASKVDCTSLSNVTSSSACYIDGVVGCNDAGPCGKDGYNYFMTGDAPAAGTVLPDYAVSAGPQAWGVSGSHNWCSSSSMNEAVLRSVPGTTTTLTAPETVAGCASPSNYEPLGK